MAAATYQDVETSLGRPLVGTAAQDQVEWWLTGVELVITSRLGDVSLLDQDALRYVEVEVVAEKVRTTRDESSITVAVDDGNVTRRYDRVTATDVGSDLWAMLSPLYTGTAYTIPTVSPRDLP